MAVADFVVIGIGQQEDCREGEDEPRRCVSSPGGCAGGDVDLGGRPLEGHSQQVGHVPGSGHGESDLEPDVGCDATEYGADQDADEHLPRVPVADFEGFLEVLLLEVLFEDPRVEIIVHVLVEPRQRPPLDRLEARGCDRSAIGRALYVGHVPPP